MPEWGNTRRLPAKPNARWGDTRNVQVLLTEQAEFAGTNGEFRRIETERKRTHERAALEETSDEYQ